MNKFTFATEGKQYIKHNLVPDMLIQVIFNREDDDLDIYNDVYDMIEFRGHEIIAKWVDYDEDFHIVEDFSHIRSILRKALKWYKSQVHIERFTEEPAPMETDRYIISQTNDKLGWVCMDKDYGLMITWRDRMFNDTQEVESLGEIKENEMILFASLMRELADWLAINHSDKV
ncbi:hypothetical protein ACR79R_20130 [Sphingobacterium spiritivorum]|uniref:hypothetical protein n=1 Tax=Sphingobacterium spiritivorum TaxID=258 RepID=UPI003DA33C93